MLWVRLRTHGLGEGFLFAMRNAQSPGEKKKAEKKKKGREDAIVRTSIEEAICPHIVSMGIFER